MDVDNNNSIINDVIFSSTNSGVISEDMSNINEYEEEGIHDQHLGDEPIDSAEENSLLAIRETDNQASQQPDRNSPEQCEEFILYMIEKVSPKKRDLMKRKYNTLKENGGTYCLNASLCSLKSTSNIYLFNLQVLSLV